MPLRPMTAAALLLAATTAGAGEPAAPERTREARATWTLDARAAALGGAFDGQGVRRESGGLLVLEAALTPERQRGGFTLALPLRFENRSTFGADLPEVSGSAAVEPSWKVARRVELGLEGGVSGAWRSGWPDLYDGLQPTDRYSYLAWRGGASLWARPAAGQHLRLKYRYVSTRYLEDAGFDPADPMHLTPRDNGQHQVTASWRFVRPGYAVALRVDYAHRQDFTLLARNAGDGSWNATTNPTQRLDQVEPSIELELKDLGGKADVTLEYGYEAQQDPFQGYYSYRGHHPAVRVAYPFTRRLEGGLRVEGWFRTFGPDSRTNTEDGDRLTYLRGLVRGELAYALGGGVSLTARAEWVRRVTNYAPNSATFAWDHTNLAFLSGVEWRN